MASHTHDDGFHEIQLNGKQLVFLFMAATVVSVVIFLCGVLVGRGVRAERAVANAAIGENGPITDLRPDVANASSVDTPAPMAGDPTTAPPPPPVDELSYPNRLESTEPLKEHLKLDDASAAAGAKAPAPAPAAAAKTQAASAAAVSEPSSGGFTLQLAALRDRAEAEQMAKRLTTKGYEAYVTMPAAGAPQVYRVRVGKYATRGEAETVAAKLQKEERFTPWITR